MLRLFLPPLVPPAWRFFLHPLGTLRPEPSGWDGEVGVLPPGASCCSLRHYCKQRGVTMPVLRPPGQAKNDRGGCSPLQPQSTPAGVEGGTSGSTSSALTRLLERARSPGELLRWLSQNPGKASATHYALALCRLACLLPTTAPAASSGSPERKKLPLLLLAHPDFQFLSRGLASGCTSLGRANLLGCLAASVVLGLPADCPLVQALEREAHRRRLDHFALQDAALAFSCALRLHPADPLTPALECQQAPRQRQQVLKRCRTLSLALQEGDLALVEEMLALCTPEAGDTALAAIFRSQLFSRNRQERFVHRMADWFPGKAEGLTPSTMALVAKHLARHRLREPRLLDTVATFLLRRIEHLDNKMIQRLVFPLSRLNYCPSNHAELFPRLAGVLGRRASPSLLATLNILLSLCQLQFCPPPSLLRQVFSPAFLANVTGSPCGQIARRYLSLLDVAVALEVPGYDGPRLDPQYRVRMFDGTLTADEANRKYSYKGLVAAALQELVGQNCYRQDDVVPPGYGVDFLLRVSSSGHVLPFGGPPHASGAAAPICAATATATVIGSPTSEAQNAAAPRPKQLGGPAAEDIPPPEGSPGPLRPTGTPHLSSPSKTEASLGSSSSSSHSSSGSTAYLRFPTWGAAAQQEPLEGQGCCSSGVLTGPPISPDFSIGEGTAQGRPQKAEEIHRLVLTVNDKWHYCQNSDVLVGSRAMRNRHLCLLGYHLLQLPYWELERLHGLEEARQYLRQKLKELQF